MASNQILRTLQAVQILSEHTAHGISQAELARMMEIQSTEAGRIISNLQQGEWAERTPHNERLVRLTPKVGALATKITESLRNAREQLRNDVSNYSGY